MRTDPSPIEVRELVLGVFDRFDGQSFTAWEIDETILVDNGRYVARTYKVEGYMAMWLIDIGIVQFYDGGGNMLMTVNLLEELEPQRMAA